MEFGKRKSWEERVLFFCKRNANNEQLLGCVLFTSGVVQLGNSFLNSFQPVFTKWLQHASNLQELKGWKSCKKKNTKLIQLTCPDLNRLRLIARLIPKLIPCLQEKLNLKGVPGAGPETPLGVCRVTGGRLDRLDKSPPEWEGPVVDAVGGEVRPPSWGPTQTRWWMQIQHHRLVGARLESWGLMTSKRQKNHNHVHTCT